MASCAPTLPALDRFDASARLIAARVAGEQREVAIFGYCDPVGALLGIRCTGSNVVDAVELPVRRIAIDALAFGAAAVVMAHNHPSGEAWPSRMDRDMTVRIARALDALGVRLHDHLVVGRRGEQWSFRTAGLL